MCAAARDASCARREAPEAHKTVTRLTVVPTSNRDTGLVPDLNLGGEMRVLIQAAAVAGLSGALLLAGCGGGSSAPKTEATPVATSAATKAATAASTAAASATAAASPAGASKRTLGATTFNDRGTANGTGKTEVAVSTENFAFAPSFVQGTPGSKVTLVVKNDSTTGHNVSLSGQSIDKNVAAGATERIEVSIPASGALLFFCKFHAGSGMNGELLSGAIEPQPIAASAGGGAGAAPTASSGGSEYGY